MPEKLKGSDGAAGTADNQQASPQQAGAPDAGKQGNAPAKSGKPNESRLDENRRRMGVDKDHRTPDMKKGGRGTFP